MPSTILVADDEKNIVQLVRLYLSTEGYAVESAADGVSALDAFQRLRPALVILDVMLPQLDGWDVLRRIRTESRTPVIMLSARTEDVDKVVGLELGADDYVTKPFNPKELAARVRAILRRTQGQPAPEQIVEVGDLAILPARREVRVQGAPVTLRAKEFDLLLALARQPGRVLTREALLSDVWDYAHPGATRTVDVHVKFLRDKLASSALEIQSVRGYGYKLVA
ncbi:MAG TPA: response regulator transcription factor [Chloroflexota bacterium]|nr:response regulator transcription factor [Chloroflexota bacterium]